jgi:hypothetical protein
MFVFIIKSILLSMKTIFDLPVLQDNLLKLLWRSRSRNNQSRNRKVAKVLRKSGRALAPPVSQPATSSSRGANAAPLVRNSKRNTQLVAQPFRNLPVAALIPL